MSNRVYGNKIDIDAVDTASFYDQRAKTVKDRKQEYTTVLLGDQDPEYAVKWDKYEKEFITPKLGLNKEMNVLDLGCGMGRWADSIADRCGIYCGVDFSAEMIAVARERAGRSNCLFYNLSVKDALADERVNQYRYDVIIVTGVSMYINDDELCECYKGISKIADSRTLIYFEESVGRKERLTLDHIWSENLNSYYGAIYRTREEYVDLIRKNMTGVSFIEDGFMDILDKEEQSETSHWYSLLTCGGK